MTKTKEDFNWMKERIYEVGQTRKAVSEALGIDPSHLYRYVFNKQRFKPEQIITICRMLQFSEKEFIKFIAGRMDKNSYNELKLIPIDSKDISFLFMIGFVEAGKWNEACQLPESEWRELYYSKSKALDGKRIFALGVKGNSMNKRFPPETTTLICCHIEDYPLPIENGDYVIAQRISKDGLCESTVKKYSRMDDGVIILEAESTDPRYTNIVVSEDGKEYSIIAVVIDFNTKLKTF